MSWVMFMLLSYRAVPRRHVKAIPTRRLYHFMFALLGFIGVAIGAYLLVNSILLLSISLGIHEYFLSFFLTSIGTSLPEFVVDLTAVRRKEYELAIGDIIGSCVVDATLSIGIGQMVFPTKVSGELARTTGIYTFLVSLIVLFVLAWRQKMDRKAGALFLMLYAFSYVALMR